MPLLLNPLETGTSGTAISTGNSGGPSIDAFDQVTATATCAVNFDSTHVGHGNMGMLCQTGGTAGEAYVMWSSRLGGVFTTLYPRAYLYLTANPGTQTRLFRWLSSSTVRGSVQITTAGKLLISDSVGTGVGTSTNSIPLNQLVRVEARCTGDAAAGVLEVKLFDSPESTSPLETVTATAQNTGGTIDRVRFGQTGTAVASVTYWLDDLAVYDGGYPGPVGAAADPLSWVPSLLHPSVTQVDQAGIGQFFGPWWDPNPAASGDATVTVAAPADATADAIVPTVVADSTVTSAVATATADALAPAVAANAGVIAVMATATADGIVPGVAADAGVAAVTATATADALAPAVSGSGSPDATVTVPAAADATATALVPTVTADSAVTAVQAAATADALPPTPVAGASVTAVMATATADALPPTVGVSAQVLAVIADATAAALLPTISAGATVTAVMATATADTLAPASIGGPLNVPRWVEGGAGGSGIREGSGDGTASAEATSGGSTFREGIAGGASFVEGSGGGGGIVEGG